MMNSQKINILFSSYPDYSGNPKALYEYINQNFSKNFNLYWVIYSDNILPLLQNKNINVVLFKSEAYDNLINSINIIFDTNGFLFSEKKRNQIYVNLWHGSSPKKKGYLLNTNNLAEQDYDYYKLAQRKTDYLIVPSEFSKLIFSSVFNINAQKVLPLGYSRDEYLYNCNGINNLQKLTNINLSNFDKIIFYLPTFRNGLNRSDTKSIFENNLLNINNYNETDLFNYLEKNNYLMVIKKHPAETDSIKNISHPNILILDENMMTEKLITIYEILNAADLLIADYSSVYVEYLILEKPVIFFHKDIETYKNNRGLILEENNIWFPGPKVLSLNDFFEQTTKLLSNSEYYAQERHEFKKLMFNDSKTISKDIFNYFFDSKDFSLRHEPHVHNEELLEDNIKDLNSNIEKLNSNIRYLESELKYLRTEYNKLSDLYGITSEDKKILKTELDNIYNSKSWKLLSLFQKIKRGGKK